LLLLPLLVVSITQIDAQSSQSTAAPDELFRTIASLDAALFDAYNQCDVEKFVALLADDLEFYHDQGGLTRGNQTVGEQIKKTICGKVRRELVPGTLEVYPMRGYGAVEIGVHRFHHPNAESTEPVGEAKFIHLWQKEDGVWKITRVISYDHHALPK
jgi:ketosteroid isomerase-like protein